MVHQIKAHNKAANADKKGKPIKAVGIFGSDFYDKLIILEAFRRELPNLVYFTTDLDAQMLQPEYWNWTRNLIVASHFDLRLRDDLQSPFPPFRDNLQTEVFYRTLKEFTNNALKYTGPLVFEIGRNGPVHLSQNTHATWFTPLERIFKDIVTWINEENNENNNTSRNKSIHPSYGMQDQLLSNLVYFTQMLQPKYWNCSHNLIVASHFDLRPPYSLQTEVFFRNVPEYTGPDDINCLKKETDSSQSVHPNYDHSKQLIYYLSFCFLITIALIITEYLMRPNSGAQSFWLSGTAIVLFLLMLYAIYDIENEPFSFTDGVSIWPTILIRVFTFLLACAFIIKMVRVLEVSFDRLNRGFFNHRLINEYKPIFIDDSRKNEVEVLKYINQLELGCLYRSGRVPGQSCLKILENRNKLRY
ncbi:MAG: hypothetical protein H6936_11500 [Burkholderiales bacterium]|nr:hypothetical protein [Burkholderiales bacterium]